jgi:methylated-DNA-[protein]-cysteine S-methyltransferase
MKKTTRKMTPFTAAVLAVVARIPKGETMSYGEVARAAGRPGAARAVGMIMKNNLDESIPCHRVVRADGDIGGYNGLRGVKRTLLEQEGAGIAKKRK